MVHVPFKGGQAALGAVLSKTVEMHFGNSSDLVEPVKNGTVKALAVSTRQRMPQLPDVPTVAETIPGFEYVAWNGYAVTGGVPPRSQAPRGSLAERRQRPRGHQGILQTSGSTRPVRRRSKRSRVSARTCRSMRASSTWPACPKCIIEICVYCARPAVVKARSPDVVCVAVCGNADRPILGLPKAQKKDWNGG